MNREDLAITKDLLESKRGGDELQPDEVAASSRVFSTLYMRIYSEHRQLAAVTGIPAFPYPESADDFPAFDFPVLRRAINCLGGEEFCTNKPILEIASNYGSQAHFKFGYALGALLVSARDHVLPSTNDRNSLISIRTLLHQFLSVELNFDLPKRWETFHEFLVRSTDNLLTAGERIARKSKDFSRTWRELVPEPSMRSVGITTATEIESVALMEALSNAGYSDGRPVKAGNGLVMIHTKGANQRVVHIRTSAGSFGLNSAGGILQAAMADLRLNYIISVGICFGLKPAPKNQWKQKLGDVLISTHVCDYETNRVGDEIKHRGDKTSAGTGLLQAARMVVAKDRSRDFQVFEGMMLSGQKLVDNEDLVGLLRANFPEAIGGEMEGNAVASIRTDWLVIKGICDWGMKKNDKHQAAAAKHACQISVQVACMVLDADET